MAQLTPKSAGRLREILRKRTDHEFSAEELQQAYDSLMEFAIALVDLTPQESQAKKQIISEVECQTEEIFSSQNQFPIAISNYPVVHC